MCASSWRSKIYTTRYTVISPTNNTVCIVSTACWTLFLVTSIRNWVFFAFFIGSELCHAYSFYFALHIKYINFSNFHILIPIYPNNLSIKHIDIIVTVHVIYWIVSIWWVCYRKGSVNPNQTCILEIDCTTTRRWFLKTTYI